MTGHFLVGTAGWSIPKDVRDRFPQEGSLLQRYAQRFTCAEINSTFYRSHRPATFERWAATVPAGFRFSLKIPKAVTHERRLIGCGDLLDRFLDETAGLGEKRAVLLVQIPPKLSFEADVAKEFWQELRARTQIAVVFEPRNPGWFTPEADAMLRAFEVSRAAADPVVVPDAAFPGGDPSMAYYRLHGSPRTYYSDYDEAALEQYASVLRAAEAEQGWCIFDNTASGAATSNALDLNALLNGD